MSGEDGIPASTEALGAVAAVATVALVVGSFVGEFSLTTRTVAIGALAVVLFGVAIGAGREDSLSFPVLVAVLCLMGYGFAALALGPALSGAWILGGMLIAVAAAYVLHERLLSPTPWAARYLAPGTVLALAVLVAIDFQAGGVAYELNVGSEVEIVEDEQHTVELGTATAENEFVFREPVSFPRADACIYWVNEDGELERTVAEVRYEAGGQFFHTSVGGGETLTTEATIRLIDAEAEALDGTVPVDRAETCPDDVGEPRIVVQTVDDEWS